MLDMPVRYSRLFAAEFAGLASKWRTRAEVCMNVAGYLLATYLWLTGAASWQVVAVGGCSAFLTIVFIYLAGRSAWETEHAASENMKAELSRVRETSPRLRLREPGAVHVHQNVSFFRTEVGPSEIRRRVLFCADFLKISFINDPAQPSPSAEARGVLATIEFFENGRLIRELHGRWSESTQPGDRIAKSESTMDLLRMDFGIGDARTLDVAMKVVSEPDAFMYCNDNYHFPDMKPPQFRLKPGHYIVRVRLRAVYVDEVFECAFRHRGTNTPLEITPLVPHAGAASQ